MQARTGGEWGGYPLHERRRQKKGPRVSLELRCICMDVGFADLWARCRREGLDTVDRVADATGCGEQCRTCRPYIALMLRERRVPTLGDVSADLHE